MSRINQNASITIRIKGLAIAHYNKETKNWEFIFLRGIPEHDLKISVREYRGTSNIPTEQVYLIPIDNKKIEIKTTDAVSQDSHHITSNFAQRATADDNHDARWIVDLSEDLHKEPVKLIKKNGSDGNPTNLTFLSISDATFYTDSLSKKTYQMIKNGKEPLEPRLTGGWIGLDIEWSNNTTSITEINFENMPTVALKPDDEISIYEIEINNDCNNPQKGASDFHYYYDHLIDMPDEFSEFVPSNESRGMVAMVDGDENDPPPSKEDCHIPLVSDLLGINSLGDLV